uniref:SHSP domain-containing protein n=1 Tax=Panagrolaimus superbus TaxID=310955 RepID=A0A914YQV4_9BILA
MNHFFNPFEVSEDGPHRRRPHHHHHHHHPYGPIDGLNGRQFGGQWPFPSFGPDARLRRHEWGPFEGRRLHPGFGFFESFGNRGGGFGGPHRGGGHGRGGFNFHGPEGFGPRGFFGRRGWQEFHHPQEYTSSSDSEEEEEEGKNPKKPEDIILSDNSGTDVEGVGKGKKCHHQRKGRCHFGRRHGKGKHWGPHSRRHFGRCPWNPEAAQSGDEIIPVEDGEASDFQIIQDNVTTEISNLQLQSDEQQVNQNSNKFFKIALNVNEFKAKDIRIRRSLSNLQIEAKQNAISSLGTFQRSFAYTITLPSDIDPKTIKIKLSQDGILRIKAKKSRDEIPNKEVEEEILIEE